MATESVAKSGAAPVRKSTTIRFKDSTAGSWRSSHRSTRAAGSRPLHAKMAPVIARCKANRLPLSVARRDRLPVALGRQGFDLVLDPGEADAFADVEIRLGREADLEAGRSRRFRQVQRTVQRLQRGNPRGQLFGNMLLDELRTQYVETALLGCAQEAASSCATAPPPARRSAARRVRSPGRRAGSPAASSSCGAAGGWSETSPRTAPSRASNYRALRFASTGRARQRLRARWCRPRDGGGRSAGVVLRAQPGTRGPCG